MMNSLVVIAMFALIGFTFTSASVIDRSDNEIPESVEVYRSSLESMLRNVSKLIAENADFDENMDIDSFDQENMFDDEQFQFLSEDAEEEEVEDNISNIDDLQSAEGVKSGIRCSWRRTAGRCCQSLKIFRRRVSICLGIRISSATSARLYLRINGRTIWSRRMGVRSRSFTICRRLGPVKICFKLYNLYISRRTIRVCLRVGARLSWFRFGRNLGCVYKRFALDGIPTNINKSDSFNDYRNYKNSLTSSGFKYNDNIARFEQ